MNKIFRTYNTLNASIFDLISGTTEVKQTLGLAFLLSQDKKTLQAFLKLDEIKRVTGNINLSKFSKVIVHSELISESGKRADIVIQLYKNNEPAIALIIEAKTASKSVKGKMVIDQLQAYLKPEEFPLLSQFNTYGCTLTKNDVVINHQSITAVSWHRIFEFLNKQKGLAQQFLSFISNIKGTMKFYEKEVYSIPAGGSFKYQYDHPFIYECPNEGHQYTSMKKPLYLAFRKSPGGIMEKLFGVDDVIIMNPHTDFEAFWNNKAYTKEVKDRVKYYCDNVWKGRYYDNNEKQFFILSKTNQIELPHHPKPLKNNSFRAYYKLSDILDRSTNIVEKDRD
ncbi:hypothetical protein ACFSQ0_00185 [Mesonia sediminis]|uniref:Type I restriction enzyme R protein N-terminal domain-containing protein n=1 Tax=Mesonia sediminis TaxID=1703946 RepID=A0ABW5SAU3_9FLAO